MTVVLRAAVYLFVTISLTVCLVNARVTVCLYTSIQCTDTRHNNICYSLKHISAGRPSPREKAIFLGDVISFVYILPGTAIRCSMFFIWYRHRSMHNLRCVDAEVSFFRVIQFDGAADGCLVAVDGECVAFVNYADRR